MLRHFAVLCIALLALGVSGCSEPDSAAKAADAKPPETVRATSYVFGTLVEFTIMDADPARAQRAIRAVERDFRRMHTEWHAWRAGGELTRINAALAAGERVRVSPFVRPLIEQARKFEAASGGRFNPAIGELLAVWGFQQDEPPQGRLPDFDRVRALAQSQPAMADIHLDGDWLWSDNPHVRLDFGGFAKGAALDRAVITLTEHGIENAIVNAGGDLNTLGHAWAPTPGGVTARAWSIAIRDPRDWGAMASVDLKGGENLYTSGNYERFIEAEGVRYAHILDPKTGMPVDHIISASVIHENGALADAAATALSVAGPDGWADVARAMGVTFVMLVDKQGTVLASPEMLARVTLDKARVKRVVASKPLGQSDKGAVQLSRLEHDVAAEVQ